MDSTESTAAQISHCIDKIVELAAQKECDARALFQLGYNLGRLSELTGLGRELFWDRWKVPVLGWDSPQLNILARELRKYPYVGRFAFPTECELVSTERLGS